MFSSNLFIFRIWKYLSKKRKSQLKLNLLIMIISGFSELLTIRALLPFLSVITNPDNKLALLKKNFFSEEEISKRYTDKIGQLWQNDKCEGGLIID